MHSNGVQVIDVLRVRASLADATYRSEVAVQAGFDARNSVMSRAEQVLGPVDGGVPKDLSSFFAA
jgi:flagellar hook-associated protein FlgK